MTNTDNGGANPQGGTGGEGANPNPNGAGAGEGGASGGAPDVSKLNAEIARLGGLVNGYAEKEKQRQIDADKQKEDNAKKNGEMETLYNETKTNFEKLSSDHTNATKTLEEFEKFFGDEIDATFKTLDKDVLGAITPLLDGKTNFEKAKALPGLLSVLSKSKTVGRTPANGNAPAGVDSAKEKIAKGDFIGAITERMTGGK